MSVQHAEFRAFVSNMPVRLGSFVEADLPQSITVGEAGEAVEREFVKDFSPASLPWVEAFALSRLPSPAAAAQPENQRFSEGVMRYVGETLLRTVGGEWAFDPQGVQGHGMPFIRPDSPAGEATGEPISLIGLLMTAMQERKAETFVTALAQALASFGEEGSPFRSSTGLALPDAGGRSSQSEQDFLDTFLGTVEPGTAAWVRDQANPGEWSFDRHSLARLSRQLRARYDDAHDLTGQREQFFVAGAVRFVGEVLRRAALGTWRYGADLPADDARAGQPYVQIAPGTGDGASSSAQSPVDLVPWRLIRRSFGDEDALVKAYDRAVAAAET